MKGKKDGNLLEQLEYAKESVRWLLDHSNGLVDQKNLDYWAGQVMRLRSEIQQIL